MEFMKLIVKLISGEDLRCPYTNNPIKKNAMALIRTPSTPVQVFSTTLDKNNGCYPCWNETFRVEMAASAHWFDIEIRRGMDTVIGVARVPVSDFMNSLVPVGYLNFLSYRLRQSRHGGFISGIINISVRVIPNKDQCCSFRKDNISIGQPVIGGTKGEDGNCSRSVNCLTYGYGGRHDHIGSGVVTGIPVSYGMNKK